MGEILSTFGIFLAVFTYMESLFHERISSSLEIVPATHKSDNKLKYENTSKVLIFKQLPLLLMGIIISLIMLPVSKEIFSEVFKLYKSSNSSYDVVKAGLLFINGCFIVISIVQLFRSYKLIKKLQDLKYK